jgi:hypothetical protein
MLHAADLLPIVLDFWELGLPFWSEITFQAKNRSQGEEHACPPSGQRQWGEVAEVPHKHERSKSRKAHDIDPFFPFPISAL